MFVFVFLVKQMVPSSSYCDCQMINIFHTSVFLWYYQTALTKGKDSSRSNIWRFIKQLTQNTLYGYKAQHWWYFATIEDWCILVVFIWQNTQVYQKWEQNVENKNMNNWCNSVCRKNPQKKISNISWIFLGELCIGQYIIVSWIWYNKTPHFEILKYIICFSVNSFKKIKQKIVIQWIIVSANTVSM